MTTLQCPQCNNNKVIIIDPNIICLTCGHSEYLYDYRNSYDEPIGSTDYVDLAELQDRVKTLEDSGIQPQKGSLPARFKGEITELRAQIRFLQRKLIEMVKAIPNAKPEAQTTQPIVPHSTGKAARRIGVKID